MGTRRDGIARRPGELGDQRDLRRESLTDGSTPRSQGRDTAEPDGVAGLLRLCGRGYAFVLAPPLRSAALIIQGGSKRFAPLHLPSRSAPPEPGHIYCLLSGVTLKFRAAIFLTLLMGLGAPSVLHAQSVTLAWDANTEPDIAGYRL